MTNKNKNNQIKKIIKRMLLMVMLVSVHLTVLEINMPKEVLAAYCSNCNIDYYGEKCDNYCSGCGTCMKSNGTIHSKCHTCGADTDSNGYCSTYTHCTTCWSEYVYGENGEYGYCENCEKWKCNNCKATEYPSYTKYCALCKVWWGTSECEICRTTNTVVHYCCGETCGNSENHHTEHNITVVVNKEATCTEKGSQIETCSNINHGQACPLSRTVTIPATGHSFTSKENAVLKQSGDSSSANIYYYSCSDCGTSAKGIDESKVFENILDDKGPGISSITTNADLDHRVFERDIEVRIESCYDESGIKSYEWQRSTDGEEWSTLKNYYTDSSVSTVTESGLEEGRYYYRVIVSDIFDNLTTSEVVFVDYIKSTLIIPIIELRQVQTIDETGAIVAEIRVTITSTMPIEKVYLNGNDTLIGGLQETVANNIITTTFGRVARENGVYTFTVTDTAENSATESINVNIIDSTKAEINAKAYDATAISNAQIVFTSNEPVRIVNAAGYAGITFDTSNFGTTIIATIQKDFEYKEKKVFKFENKALLKTDVEVSPPIITKVKYLRFAKDEMSEESFSTEDAMNLVKKINELMISKLGKIVSYYGFYGPVNIETSTQSDIDAATGLGGAGMIQIMDRSGSPKELKATTESTVGNNSGIETVINTIRATIKVR